MRDDHEARVGVIFDVDGTLVDTTYIHTLCGWQALTKNGITIPRLRLYCAVGMGAEQLVSHVTERLLQPDRREQVSAAHAAPFATWREVVRRCPAPRPSCGGAGRGS